MSTSGTEDPRHIGWLEAVEAAGRDLSKWEQDFIESIRDRFDRGWTTLSDKQAEILERIYSEKTP